MFTTDYKKRYLVFGDGEVFEGRAFGADKETVGELVFATGMCGYTETLTDPSYYGQIVLQTFPLIGNYGVNPDDFEGECALFGYVVREYAAKPSNFRSRETLDDMLKERGIPGIYGVDTRRITEKIRTLGTANAAICDEVPIDLSYIKDYKVEKAVGSVASAAVAFRPAEGNEKYRVTLIDFGFKKNIVNMLTKRGCGVTIVPPDFSAEQILSSRPDGIMLSNGPGDPKENAAAIAELKKLIGRLPIFGICLGHQLFALAMGGDTYKLKFGHRGVNQPVRYSDGHRTFITSQNHGYAVAAETVKGGVESYVNANDLTNEGMDYPELKAFTVQFHPEACSGPKDTAFLFDRFIALMDGSLDQGVNR